MVEWLKMLIFSALNCSSSASSCPARVICGTSQILLAGGQVFFLGAFPFTRHLLSDSAQNEWKKLDGP